MNSKFLYVMGAESGVGKSTVCLGLLAQLLESSIQASELAYIKPMTQCLDTQAVAQFCANNGIACNAIYGLVFAKGFTRQFIAGLTKSSEELLKEVLANIEAISKGKQWVIIDGIGGPSAGSVIGVSNADIALALACTVIFVGKPGLGAAIDNSALCLSFIQSRGIKDVSIIYNNLSLAEITEVQSLIAKRTHELFPNCRLLGFVCRNELLDTWVQNDATKNIAQWFVQFLELDKIYPRSHAAPHWYKYDGLLC